MNEYNARNEDAIHLPFEWAARASESWRQTVAIINLTRPTLVESGRVRVGLLASSEVAPSVAAQLEIRQPE